MGEKEVQKNEALERMETLIKLKNTLKAEETSLNSKLSSLNLELNDRQEAGAVRKILLRSEVNINADITASTNKLEATKTESSSVPKKIKDQDLRINNLKDDVKHLKETLKGKDQEAQAQKKLNDINEKRGPLEAELSDARSELENLREKILEEAKVIGATVTRTYLHHKEFVGFKNVVIDEASMVLLPAFYHVVGLASEKCVISGDFRQIAPIVDTKQKDLHDVISKDIFDASGIEQLSHSGRNTKNLIMLKQQYRMQDNICNLVNSFMYRGNLVTAESKLQNENTLSY